MVYAANLFSVQFTRHLLESTHTNTHKHKQTHSAARQSTVRAHAVACMHWSQTESSKCSLDCVPYPHVTWAIPAYVKLYYNSVLLFKYLQL